MLLSIVLIGFGVLSQAWGHIEIEAEDYFFPLEPVINYCKMADQCGHDFIQVCGQDSLGVTRLFLDNCDLYEFNCDEKRQFRHVQGSTCGYGLVAAPVKPA